MAKKRRSLAERTYKAGILSGGAAYTIPPMAMITEKMKEDSRKAQLEAVEKGEEEQDE